MSKGFASNYRIVVLASLVLLSFAGLGVRLAWLHVIDRGELLDTVEKARRQIIVQYARRGDILDARDNLLATSRPLIDLGVDPQLLRKEDEKKWPQLAELTGLPLADLQRILNTRFRPVDAGAPPKTPAAEPAAFDFGFEKKAEPGKAEDEGGDDNTVVGEADASGERPIQWAKLSDGIAESTFASVQKLGIRGIYGNRVYRRVYPHNELAAHVIGYVNRGEQPVTGIESFANFYLHGQDGWVESEKDGRQVELAQFRTRDVPAADGYSVQLSIDDVIQHIVESELDTIVAKYRPQKATIIVSDPRTGFILALANTPTFDLNAYNKLGKDEQNRLRNVAVADMYEPGSVFKIVAAAGALNDGLVTPDTPFDCTLQSVPVNGVERNLPREDVGDHFDHPTAFTVSDIIAYSSNKGAAQLGVLLGARRFYDYVRAFGFGEPTGFPVGGETGGLVRPPEKWDGLTITRMPMGQSVDVTALQMHQAMSVIASGGVLLRPQLIRQIRDASGDVVYSLGRAVVRRVISANTARTMAHILARVATETGNAREAAIPGYEVAGKTGTAQMAVNGHYIEHHHVSSFVGFFPASNPQIAISVIVEDSDESLVGGTAYGHIVAAPSFRRIGEQLIPYRDIQPGIDDASHPVIAMEGGGAVIGYLTRNHALIHALQPRPTRPTRRETIALNRIFKMAPKLSDYFSAGEILAHKGDLDCPVSGLTLDSRRVVPGNVFFALPGLRADGVRFIDEAVSRGAVAVVAPTMPAHPPAKVAFIQVADARAALARVAQRYYKFPDRDMTVIGVTGTNGKTTVTHLIKHFLNGERRVGLLGTINYDLGARTVPSYRTTPESLDIFGMMAQMRDAGCREAVMEVSSHGIDQQRVLGVQFGAAVFTNLTRDHLDYHKTLDAYFEVKTRLFTGALGSPPGVAAVNLDDPHGERLAARAGSGLRLVTFGENPRAMVRAEEVVLNAQNTTFRLVWPGGASGAPRSAPVDSPLVGRYNVSNLLAALATVWSLGRDPEALLGRLRGFKGVPGRMERVEGGQGFNVFVDYAHTDDALRNALGMLRPVTPGRLLVVFGCGGNRDRTKRPLMVRAVQAAADHAFATADNPRSESLGQIFADMRAGVTAPEKITWVEDRRRAISLALDAARPGDSLLIAGKGHESYQELADTIIPFDDRQVVRELIGIKILKEG